MGPLIDACWLSGVIASWDLRRDRGVLRLGDDGATVVVLFGYRLAALSRTPHVGQRIDVQLGADGTVVAAREARA